MDAVEGAADARRDMAGEGGAGLVDVNDEESGREFGLESRVDDRLCLEEIDVESRSRLGVVGALVDTDIESRFVVSGFGTALPVGVVIGESSSEGPGIDITLVSASDPEEGNFDR